MALMLLVGDGGAGKTSSCWQLVALARGRGLSVGGIIAPAVRDAGRCTGYEVVDLATGESAWLATTSGAGAAAGLPAGRPAERVGRFYFLSAGLALGRRALARAIEDEPQLVIVDEVGPLELGGGGWAAQLDLLVARAGATVLTVRESLAGQVAQRWRPTETCLLWQGAEAVPEALLRWVEATLGDNESARPGTT